MNKNLKAFVQEQQLECCLFFMRMDSQKCGGKLLANSGWDQMYSLAKVFNSGVTASLLRCRHIKRTRYSY